MGLWPARLICYICSGMKGRFRISVIMMIISMVVLASFQAWWLRKSYGEEDETLKIRTSLLFRETVYALQVSKLQLDSNFRVPLPSQSNAVGVINVLRERVRDSVRTLPPGVKSTMILSMSNTAGDTAGNKTFMRYGMESAFDVLLGSETASDSLKVSEISQAYNKTLSQQKIDVPYKVIRTAQKPGTIRHRQPGPPNLPDRPDVTIGFMYPVTYRLELGNTVPYLLGKITPQLLFAVFLLTITSLSFLMMYRNLMAQRKLAAIRNDFISNITHELKTPIATVSVAIEALRNFNALDDPRKTREYLDISQNELQRLSLLVDKVLKLSMFENKAIELKPEMLDLKDVVAEVAASMRLQLEKFKAHLSIEHDGDTSLKGDRLHLTSVVFNLLDNALKYSRSSPAIRMEVKQADNAVLLSVVDNGLGIAPEYRERIFEKFFRVPSGDTHNAKGYGLGLSYVAHVVQKHEGTISVDSQPQIGSRFTIKLPKANE
jgi:two-component system, OmpR family, phosphate regulon sensor histidine kinase PhoR